MALEFLAFTRPLPKRYRRIEPTKRFKSQL